MDAVAILSCDLEPTHCECGSNHATTESRWSEVKKRKCLNVVKVQDYFHFGLYHRFHRFAYEFNSNLLKIRANSLYRRFCLYHPYVKSRILK